VNVMQGISEAIEFFESKVFFISFGQIAFMFLACFLCLLYGRYKTGLLVSYFFIFYWGFFSNRIYWMELFGDSGIGLMMYFFSATTVALMGVISFFQPDHR
jgi:hypothetical protein